MCLLPYLPDDSCNQCRPRATACRGSSSQGPKPGKDLSSLLGELSWGTSAGEHRDHIGVPQQLSWLRMQGSLGAPCWPQAALYQGWPSSPCPLAFSCQMPTLCPSCASSVVSAQEAPHRASGVLGSGSVRCCSLLSSPGPSTLRWWCAHVHRAVNRDREALSLTTAPPDLGALRRAGPLLSWSKY